MTRRAAAVVDERVGRGGLSGVRVCGPPSNVSGGLLGHRAPGSQDSPRHRRHRQGPRSRPPDSGDSRISTKPTKPGDLSGMALPPSGWRKPSTTFSRRPRSEARPRSAHVRGGWRPAPETPLNALRYRLYRRRCRVRTVARRVRWARKAAMTAGAPPSLTIRTSPNPACDNRSATACALRRTSSRRCGSAHTDSIRTRSSRSRRTDGNTSRTRSTRSLMTSRLAGRHRPSVRSVGRHGRLQNLISDCRSIVNLRFP
jgi:hypothetical protein